MLRNPMPFTPIRRRLLNLCVMAGMAYGTAPPVLAQQPGAPPPVAPPAYQRAVLTTGNSIACPPMPRPYTGTLSFGSKYDGSGPARDQIDPAADAAYKNATASIHDFEADVAGLTDAYMRSGDADGLSCLLRIFNRWAAAHALEADATTYGGKSIRKWALASAAGAYLRLAASASQPLRSTPAVDANIRAWLTRLAAKVMAEWDLTAPDPKINNQTYWAGWSVMAVSVIAGRRDFYGWGLTAYRRGLAQVDGDGYLPSELARGTRALAYHNYALQPLTMLAVFARANAAPTTGAAALDRLVRRTVAGLDDPSIFTAKTGIAQNVDGLQSPQAYVWLEAYCAQTACSADLAARLAADRPLHANRLGGGVTAIFGP